LPDKPPHFFWQIAQSEGLIDLANAVVKELGCQHLILRGEILGPNIQSNIYHLSARKVLFFDIQVEQRYLDADKMLGLFERHGRQDLMVPILSRDKTLAEWLAGQSISQAANGESKLHKTMREGIVIRPSKEQFSPELSGRLIIKQISPEYLAQG